MRANKKNETLDNGEAPKLFLNKYTRCLLRIQKRYLIKPKKQLFSQRRGVVLFVNFKIFG